LEPPTGVPLLGVPLAVTDYEQTLAWIDAAAAARRTTSASPPFTP
jgi:hypothetical protein